MKRSFLFVVFLAILCTKMYSIINFENSMWASLTLFGLIGSENHDDVPLGLVENGVLPLRCEKRGYGSLVRAVSSTAADSSKTTSIGKRFKVARSVGFSSARYTFLKSAAQSPTSTWEEAPRKPIVIAGLGRSGTTLLHRLLAENPSSMSLKLSDMVGPVNVPEAKNFETRKETAAKLSEKKEKDRIFFGLVSRENQQKFMQKFMKHVMGVDEAKVSQWHELNGAAPEEDFLVLLQAGLNTLEEFELDVLEQTEESVRERRGNNSGESESTRATNSLFLNEQQQQQQQQQRRRVKKAQAVLRNAFDKSNSCEAREAYDYLKAFLMFQQNHPETKALNAKQDHWVLKSPVHALFMDSAASALPNAQFVFLHRSPEKLIPSLAHLLYAMRRTHFEFEEEDDDESSFGVLNLKEGFLKATELAMAKTAMQFLEWEKENPGKAIHIKFETLVQDPLQVVDLVYNETMLRDPKAASLFVNQESSRETRRLQEEYLEKDKIKRTTTAFKPKGVYSAKDFGWEPAIKGQTYLEDLYARYPVWKEYARYHS